MSRTLLVVVLALLAVGVGAFVSWADLSRTNALWLSALAGLLVAGGIVVAQGRGGGNGRR